MEWVSVLDWGSVWGLARSGRIEGAHGTIGIGDAELPMSGQVTSQSPRAATGLEDVGCDRAGSICSKTRLSPIHNPNLLCAPRTIGSTSSSRPCSPTPPPLRACESLLSPPLLACTQPRPTPPFSGSQLWLCSPLLFRGLTSTKASMYTPQSYSFLCRGAREQKMCGSDCALNHRSCICGRGRRPGGSCAGST